MNKKERVEAIEKIIKNFTVPSFGEKGEYIVINNVSLIPLATAIEKAISVDKGKAYQIILRTLEDYDQNINGICSDAISCMLVQKNIITITGEVEG